MTNKISVRSSMESKIHGNITAKNFLSALRTNYEARNIINDVDNAIFDFRNDQIISRIRV